MKNISARLASNGMALSLASPTGESFPTVIAFTLHSFASSQVRYIAINAYWKPLEFALPPVTGEPGGRLASPYRHFPAIPGRHR